jgi:hypothetical protein
MRGEKRQTAPVHALSERAGSLLFAAAEATSSTQHLQHISEMSKALITHLNIAEHFDNHT